MQASDSIDWRCTYYAHAQLCQYLGVVNLVCIMDFYLIYELNSLVLLE